MPLNDENSIASIKFAHNNGRSSSGQINHCSHYSRQKNKFTFYRGLGPLVVIHALVTAQIYLDIQADISSFIGAIFLL